MGLLLVLVGGDIGNGGEQAGRPDSGPTGIGCDDYDFTFSEGAADEDMDMREGVSGVAQMGSHAAQGRWLPGAP